MDTNTILLIYLSVINLVSFATYGIDKRAAKKQGRRTPEKTLHLMALLGGWPGALIAQQTFRHKTRKAAFQFLFWITVIANCTAVYYAFRLEWISF